MRRRPVELFGRKPGQIHVFFLDLQTFETFVRLCAGRVGQILNLTSLANDTGIFPTTAREWLGLLETSFVLFRLTPFHANIGKGLGQFAKIRTDRGPTGMLVYGGAETQERNAGTVTGIAGMNAQLNRLE